MMRDRQEWLRWAGSIGIFYVLIPSWIVASDFLYKRFLPIDLDWHQPIWSRWCLAAIGVIGILLAYGSIRAQVVRADGHPFDITGRQRLSRPTKILLTDGVYYWTRNPMGLGDILLYAGFAGALNLPRSLAINVPAYAVIVVWNHMMNERPRLVADFGQEYLDYERTTSCLIPGVKSIRKWSARIRG